jgi:two-component system LytT family response regulator
MVKSKRRILFINAEDVDWIESAGNYVRLHCGGTSYLLRETMMSLEQSLDPERFTRIHRSTMVNADRVAEIQANACGDYDLILNTGERLRMSRGYRHRMLR